MRFAFLTLLIFTSLISFGVVIPRFTCDATRGCSPLVVNTTDHSTGGVTSWYWDLGNGNTSTLRNPSATYLAPGTYTIRLRVSDGTQVDSSTQVITVFQKPSVNFTSDITTGCANDSILFTTQVLAGSSSIRQYAWGFGNGIASSDKDPLYKYSQSGSYDVTLVVEDSNGCVANITKPAYIHIYPSPSAAFSLTPAVSCGVSQAVTFTDHSIGSGLVYSWSFGDSTFSTQANPIHTYTYSNYKAKLTVLNNYGCSSSIQKNVQVININATFSADKTRACAGEDINFQNNSPMPGSGWSWNFGDGGTSNKQNPKHIYTQPGVYSVTFVIKDAICKDSITRQAYITITQGFSLSFASDKHTSCTAPFTVNFTSSASTAPLHYAWSFGDGNSDTTATPSHVYQSASIFNVALTAIDTNGCKISLASPGMISTGRPGTMFVGDTLTCPGSAVRFTNRTLNATSYLWQFGDGDTSTAKNPAHVYTAYGDYTVTLTASDTTGCDSVLIKTAFVHVDSAKVDFKVDRTFSTCPPLVSVFSSMTNRPDLKMRWDFGDGYTDTAVNPTHIFFHPGIYTVRLIGTSRLGCTDTIVYPHLIEVQGPSGDFALTPVSGCLPLSVGFSGTTSSNVQSITCDLGNGSFYADSLNFHYTYTSARVYHPKFILVDHIGCTVPYDLDSIVARGSMLVSTHDTAICPGQPVHMALGSDHYSWTGRACDTCGRVPNITDTVAVATLAPNVTTTYTVIASNNAGCTSQSSFVISVVPLPSLHSSDTVRLCSSEATYLSVGQADSIRWSPAIYINNPTAMSPRCNTPTSATYTAIGYNRLGCSATAQVPVKVTDRVRVSVIADTIVCPGSTVQLHVQATDSSMQGVTYLWSPSAVIGDRSEAHPLIEIGTQSQTLSVITSSGGCIPDTSTVTISVAPAASVRLPASVTTTVETPLYLAPVSGDLISYVWSAADSLSCIDCKATTLVPYHTQMVYLSGTNSYGCIASDSMQVSVLQCDPASVFVPNTFTPNGDGQHDVLYVRSRTMAQLESFRVFDRWGAVVYEGRDMSDGWDGTIRGTAASQGVYMYTVAGKCSSGYDLTASGTVTLLR